MTAEENKQVLARGFAAMNAGDLDTLMASLAPDYVNYAFPDAHGPEAMRAVLQSFYDGFPDMQIDVQEMVAEGNTVASRGVMRGTHRGAFMGIPATGKPVEISYIDLWRFVDGKATENWVQMDMLGMMQQIGVAPAPGQR